MSPKMIKIGLILRVIYESNREHSLSSITEKVITLSYWSKVEQEKKISY